MRLCHLMVEQQVHFGTGEWEERSQWGWGEQGSEEIPQQCWILGCCPSHRCSSRDIVQNLCVVFKELSCAEAAASEQKKERERSTSNHL